MVDVWEGPATVISGPGLYKKCYLRRWRDGSMVNTGCSSRGPGFNFQNQHGASRPLVVPVSGDLEPSGARFGHSMYMFSRQEKIVR